MWVRDPKVAATRSSRSAVLAAPFPLFGRSVSSSTFRPFPYPRRGSFCTFVGRPRACVPTHAFVAVACRNPLSLSLDGDRSSRALLPRCENLHHVVLAERCHAPNRGLRFLPRSNLSNFTDFSPLKNLVSGKDRTEGEFRRILDPRDPVGTPEKGFNGGKRASEVREEWTSTSVRQCGSNEHCNVYSLRCSASVGGKRWEAVRLSDQVCLQGVDTTASLAASDRNPLKNK